MAVNEKGKEAQFDERFDDPFDELFARLLDGSLKREDDVVREALAEHPHWAPRLDDAAELAAPLRSAADTRRSLIREGLAERDAGDEALARSFLKGALPPPSPWWRQPWLLAAAILLVVGGTWLQRSRSVDGEPGPGTSGPLSSTSTPLDGEGQSEGPSPVGMVGSLGTIDAFLLPEELPVGGTATIVVYDRSTPDAPPVLETTIEERRWTLDDDQRAALPSAFTWEYVVRDVTGEAVGRGRFEVSSSP